MRRGTRLAPLLALALVVLAVWAPMAIGAVVNVSMEDDFFQRQFARPSLGDTVTWTNNGGSPHNSRSTNTIVKNYDGTSGIDLWRGPVLDTGGTFSRVFRASGRFLYYCEIHAPGMRGTVSVPLKAAKSTVSQEDDEDEDENNDDDDEEDEDDGSSTRITVTWATAAPPAGLVFDVQRRLPGSTTFQDWKVGVTTTSASFVATTPGTYSFRSRVRRPSTGGVTFYSEVKSVTALR
jgi:plastocyanin